MATQKINCRACGFGALLFTTGESTKVTVDSAKQSHLCNYLRQQPKSSTRRLGALDCRDFREAVNRLAKDDKSETENEAVVAKEPASEKVSTIREAVDRLAEDGKSETENEAVVAKEPAPEKASTKRSPRAEVAETDAGSPKAKSARRAPTKSTRRVKIHSDVPIVADGEPMVS